MVEDVSRSVPGTVGTASAAAWCSQRSAFRVRAFDTEREGEAASGALIFEKESVSGAGMSVYRGRI
jgi:hypothetical protein